MVSDEQIYAGRAVWGVDKVLPVDIVKEATVATPARTISFKLDQDTRARIEHLAESRRRTAHWIMREAITQYVEREEKREAFRQDTLKAWEKCRTTGLHVTAEETDAWLNRLEQGDDIEPPECHT